MYNRIYRSKKIKHQFYCDETLDKDNTVLLVGSFVITIAQCYYTALRLQRLSTFCILLAAKKICRVFFYRYVSDRSLFLSIYSSEENDFSLYIIDMIVR